MFVRFLNAFGVAHLRPRCIYAYMYCVYICIHVCRYVDMYIGIYVYVYICVYVSSPPAPAQAEIVAYTSSL